MDASEYPPYRLVGQVFIRAPVQDLELAPVLELPSDPPKELPLRGPW
jgi:hypothetical protein